MTDPAGSSDGRVVLYARVARADDGSGLAVQHQRCAEYAATRGWQVIASFGDVGSSAEPQRPGFEAAASAIEDSDVTAVVVTSLDRLTRRADVFARLDADWACRGASLSVVHDSVDARTLRNCLDEDARRSVRSTRRCRSR